MGRTCGDRSFGLVLRNLGLYNCNGSSDRGFSVLIPLCLELLIVGLGVIDVKVGELESESS